jgi:hypothetical protein
VGPPFCCCTIRGGGRHADVIMRACTRSSVCLYGSMPPPPPSLRWQPALFAHWCATQPTTVVLLYPHHMGGHPRRAVCPGVRSCVRGCAWVCVCAHHSAKGKMSYFASRILAAHGCASTSLPGGMSMFGAPPLLATPVPRTAQGTHAPPAAATAAAAAGPAAPPVPSAVPSVPARTVDATGMACPGPIMAVRQVRA